MRRVEGKNIRRGAKITFINSKFNCKIDYIYIIGINSFLFIENIVTVTHFQDNAAFRFISLFNCFSEFYRVTNLNSSLLFKRNELNKYFNISIIIAFSQTEIVDFLTNH